MHTQQNTFAIPSIPPLSSCVLSGLKQSVVTPPTTPLPAPPLLPLAALVPWARSKSLTRLPVASFQTLIFFIVFLEIIYKKIEKNVKMRSVILIFFPILVVV
jgi:hypothetical protein